MDLTTVNEWQRLDEKLGVPFPWYTGEFLKVLDRMNLEDKIVFEYGLGSSSIWYALRGAELFGVDHDPVWYEVVRDQLNKLKTKNSQRLALCPDKSNYVAAIRFMATPAFDMVVVDGEYWRDECVKAALPFIKKGGYMIVDNWMQPSVWMASEETQKLLLSYPVQIFRHTTHHRDWQTALVYIE